MSAGRDARGVGGRWIGLPSIGRLTRAVLPIVVAAAMLGRCAPMPEPPRDVSISVRNESGHAYVLLFFEESGEPMPYHAAVSIAPYGFGNALVGHGPWQGSVAFADSSCNVLVRATVWDSVNFAISAADVVSVYGALSDADIAHEDNIYAETDQCSGVR